MIALRNREYGHTCGEKAPKALPNDKEQGYISLLLAFRLCDRASATPLVGPGAARAAAVSHSLDERGAMRMRNGRWIKVWFSPFLCVCFA